MVSNLEWVTAKENVNHGTRTLKSSNKVICIFNDGSIMCFDSLTECANYLNITVASVSYCIKHNKPNKNGIVFHKEVN
ncbi:DNA-binding domain-containing protein [Enterococcus phage G01]|nr:DNA-binding domain-containing protein [Enterococcus phage G01]